MQTELAKNYFSSLFITNAFIIEVHQKNGQYSVDVDREISKNPDTGNDTKTLIPGTPTKQERGTQTF